MRGLALQRGVVFTGRRAILSLAGIVLLLAAAAPAWAQFSVSPVIVQVPSFEPGHQITLQVENHGENTLQFRAYAMDFDQQQSGDHVYAEPGTHPRSCGDGLAIAPGALSVAAGEVGLISLRLESAPLDRSCWSMVFIESPSAGEGQVRIHQRIGVKFYGLSEAGQLDGEVVTAAVAERDSSLNVELTFRNHGDWPIRPKGVVEIRSFDGTVVTSARVSGFSVLPGYDRDVAVSVDAAGLEPGRYLAVPILDFGAEYLAGAEVAFRVD